MIYEPVKIRYHQGERGFAIPRGGGLYVIDNLPFDGGLVNFEDVVRCRMPEDGGLPFVTEILERTYHAWSSVRYLPPTQEVYTALRLAVEAAGGHTEGAVSGSMVVVSNVEGPDELLRILSTATTETAISVTVQEHVTLHPAPIQFFGCDPNLGMPAPMRLDIAMVTKRRKMKDHPPGPRWFVGITFNFNSPTSSIRTIEGHSDEGEAVAKAFMRDVGADVVYAFVRPVDLRKVIPILQRGESLVQAFADDIDAVYFNKDNVEGNDVG